MDTFPFPFGAGDSGAFSLPYTGTYIVQFAEGAAGSADVTLYDATPVTGNITVNGSAVSLNTNPGQPLELSFSGTQGEQLLVGSSSSTYGTVSYTVFDLAVHPLHRGGLMEPVALTASPLFPPTAPIPLS